MQIKKEEINPLLVLTLCKGNKSVSICVSKHLLKQILVRIGNILYESKQILGSLI